MKNKDKKYPNMRKAELIEVFRVVVLEGDDTDESPDRLVEYFFSKDGKLLAKNDPLTH